MTVTCLGGGLVLGSEQTLREREREREREGIMMNSNGFSMLFDQPSKKA